MTFRKLLLLVLASVWALAASAQWQWIDKDGRRVFSDRPPPQEVPQKNILKQPGAAAAHAPAAPLPLPASGPASDPPSAIEASAPRALPVPSGLDKQLQEKKAQAEAAQAARKQQEEKTQAERLARQRADNCARARRAITTLNSGTRLMEINAQGERVFMDETTRAADLRRAQEAAAADCK